MQSGPPSFKLVNKSFDYSYIYSTITGSYPNVKPSYLTTSYRFVGAYHSAPSHHRRLIHQLRVCLGQQIGSRYSEETSLVVDDIRRMQTKETWQIAESSEKLQVASSKDAVRRDFAKIGQVQARCWFCGGWRYRGQREPREELNMRVGRFKASQLLEIPKIPHVCWEVWLWARNQKHWQSLIAGYDTCIHSSGRPQSEGFCVRWGTRRWQLLCTCPRLVPLFHICILYMWISTVY